MMMMVYTYFIMLLPLSSSKKDKWRYNAHISMIIDYYYKSSNAFFFFCCAYTYDSHIIRGERNKGPIAKQKGTKTIFQLLIIMMLLEMKYYLERQKKKKNQMIDDDGSYYRRVILVATRITILFLFCYYY
jgi:hypothetical protein